MVKRLASTATLIIRDRNDDVILKDYIDISKPLKVKIKIKQGKFITLEFCPHYEVD